MERSCRTDGWFSTESVSSARTERIPSSGDEEEGTICHEVAPRSREVEGLPRAFPTDCPTPRRSAVGGANTILDYGRTNPLVAVCLCFI